VTPLVTPRWRRLAPGQRSRVRILDTVSGQSQTLVESAELVLEAPDWSPDGGFLLVNSAGRLLRLSSERPGALAPVPTGPVTDVNNDHVISPDGAHVFVSSEGSGRLYRFPSAGGVPKAIVDDLGDDHARFVLGISPDGLELYVTANRVTDGRWGIDNVFAIPAGGGTARQLTAEGRRTVGADTDGHWLYVNSERGAARPGHSRLFRFPRGGGPWQQLTDTDAVDWFGKVSPDGSTLAFVRYPPGTVGHEVDRLVSIWTAAADGSGARERVRLRGGQGTMNVNSWAPDGRRLAYIDYPYDSES
jgi:Tol biopolymer transport system component